LMVLRRFLPLPDLPNPAFTTLFQATTRWNAFIALAAAELFAGAQGVALIAVAMAALIPLINISNIIVLAIYGTAKTSVKTISLMVAKNPLVQASAVGIALNLSAVPLPDFALQTLDLVGRAALGVGILAVGSSVNMARLLSRSPALWLGVLARVVGCPAVFLILAFAIGLGQLETVAGVLVLGVPAASSGYIVAKQMGGDSELYADILVWQTLLSMVFLPVFMVVLNA
jgi:malonate transporter